MTVLSHRVVGPMRGATRTAWVVHGLLGSGRNWTTFSQSLLSLSPSLRVVLVDLRGHGRSAANNEPSSFPAPHTLSACVGDLHQLATRTGLWPSACVGHSLGGKILLKLADTPEVAEDFARHAAAAAGEGPPSSPTASSSSSHIKASRASGRRSSLELFVVDSLPGTNVGARETAAPDSVWRVLQIVRQLPTPLPGRRAVRDTFLAAGLPDKLATWMASNVVSEASPASSPSSASRWAFDPLVAADLYASHMSTDVWPLLLRGPPPGVDIDLIMASRSGRWKEAEAIERLAQVGEGQRARDNVAHDDGAAAGRVRLHTVAGGHWLHVDNPGGLLDVVRGSFADDGGGEGEG
jgi:pimeloyl-ACP methyl ester carboxylesterase